LVQPLSDSQKISYVHSWVLHGTISTQSNNKMQVLQSMGFGCKKVIHQKHGIKTLAYLNWNQEWWFSSINLSWINRRTMSPQIKSWFVSPTKVIKSITPYNSTF